MPTLHWIGKDKVVTHHQDVPYRVLEHKYGFTADSSTSSGHEQTEPTNSGNKIIHGDNLEALKSLLPEYEGKIKCIYIDPPYNTGNEKWVYNDNVNHPKIKKWLGEVVGKDGEDLSRHDKWLCMMYPRIKLLHKLLADDGAIFISIDDNEQANLKLLCDEIFGVRNFVANVIWQKKFSPQNDAKYFSDNHDFVLIYSKQKDSWNRNLIERNETQSSRYKNLDNDPRGDWTSSDLTVKTYSKDYDYPISTPSGKVVNPTNGRCWMTSKENFNELVNDNRIWFGKSGSNVPRLKKFLSEVQRGIVPLTIWEHSEVGHNQSAKQDLKNIFPNENSPFDTPKPHELIERVLQIASNKNSIILDSFAGSGTTAHAVLNLNKQDGGNRKFILVEMEDYANNITAERVKRVAKGYGKDKKAVEGTGGAFDFYELGLPLFDENQNLNEEVGLQKIREYIWFSETRTSIYDLRVESDDLRVKSGDLGVKSGDLRVKSGDLGVKSDDLRVKNEDLGVKNEDLGVESGDLGVKSDDLGVKSDDLRVKNEDLGVKNEDLGVESGDLGVKSDDLGVKSDDLRVKNEDLGVKSDDLIHEKSEIRNQKSTIRNQKSKINNPHSEIINHKYELGKKDGTVYYFIYEKDKLTTLDYDALELIKTKGEQYIIYADNCLLPKDFMAKKNIIFKKIPRDITRF